METTRKEWRIRITAPAEADLRCIIRFTRDRFGVKQATTYRQTILRVPADLAAVPFLAGSGPRHALLPGLRSVHVARHQRRGRHLVFYRSVEPDLIEVLRILHDSMDFQRHFPPGL